jgi:hypothetical protein
MQVEAPSNKIWVMLTNAYGIPSCFHMFEEEILIYPVVDFGEI